jgi:hypothetical protein
MSTDRTTIDVTGCTFEDDSARSRAGRRFASGVRTNLYEAYPDREEFECRAFRAGVVVARRTGFYWGMYSQFTEWVRP